MMGGQRSVYTKLIAGFSETTLAGRNLPAVLYRLAAQPASPGSSPVLPCYWERFKSANLNGPNRASTF